MPPRLERLEEGSQLPGFSAWFGSLYRGELDIPMELSCPVRMLVG